MTEPVGPEYGLEPRIIYDDTLPPIDSVDILTNPNDYRGGTEYGGVAGPVQPPPHTPTAGERRAQLMRIDPMDDGTRPDSVPVPELEGDFLPGFG